MITLGEKAEQALRVVREAKVIAYDTETSGLDWRIHHPVGYVITESNAANFYIPVRHGGGGNLLDPDCGPLSAPDAPTKQHSFERELARAFEARREQKLLTIGHNLKFDMHSSANQGILLGRECEDTQINAALLDEHARSFSLENCAKREGVTAKKGEELYELISRITGLPLASFAYPSKIMEHFWRTDGCDPLVVDYATGDGITTLELRTEQYRQILEQEMGLIHSIESRLIWTFFRMERRGIKVDEKYIADLTKAVEKELKAAKSTLPEGFNVRSGPQVRNLMEAAGHTDWPTTEIGNPSFTEKWLKTKPEGKAIIAVRQLANLMSSFVEPLRDRHIWNGRVHCNIHQLKADEYGTISGRPSASDPNLLAVPKRNKELGPRFRRIFVASEGMEFYEADYKQCEPVLFTHYSQEPALMAAYTAVPPLDMHHVVAEMFGVERDPTAKRMNMGILTGMQPKTFAMHMGWSLEKATVMHRQWFQGFPGIKAFQDNAKRVLAHRGYVKTILGRRGRLDHPRFAYKAVSKIIQGSNADIMKAKILLCDEYLESTGDTGWLLLSIYDSLEWESPLGPEGEAQAAELIRICKDVQSPPFNLRVPLGMDVDHGPDWATATYGAELVRGKLYS